MEEDFPISTYMGPYKRAHGTHSYHTHKGVSRDREGGAHGEYIGVLSCLIMRSLSIPRAELHRVHILFLPGLEPSSFLGISIAHLLLWHLCSGLPGCSLAQKYHLEGRLGRLGCSRLS